MHVRQSTVLLLCTLAVVLPTTVLASDQTEMLTLTADACEAMGDRLDIPPEEKQPTSPVLFSENTDDQPNDE